MTPKVVEKLPCPPSGKGVKVPLFQVLVLSDAIGREGQKLDHYPVEGLRGTSCDGFGCIRANLTISELGVSVSCGRSSNGIFGTGEASFVGEVFCVVRVRFEVFRVVIDCSLSLLSFGSEYFHFRIVAGPLVNATMLKMIAQENMDEWNQSPIVAMETVKAAYEFIKSQSSTDRSVEEALANLHSSKEIDLKGTGRAALDITIERKIFEALPTQEHARDFRQAVKLTKESPKKEKGEELD